MVKPQHISPGCCLCILQPGPCHQRTKISSECQDAVWKGLVDAALRMPLYPFGTLSLPLLNVPLPLIPSRAAWRLIYLMWRIIPRSTESYIVSVYCYYRRRRRRRRRHRIRPRPRPRPRRPCHWCFDLVLLTLWLEGWMNLCFHIYVL